MGNWHIAIRGLGAHHNGIHCDANEMAKVFVAALRAAGHQVLGATFTSGGEDNLDPPAAPPAPSTEG